jgi:predicted outer membrane repeat protein
MSVRYKDCNIYNNMFSGNFSALGGGLGVLHIPEVGHRINTNFFTDNIALYFGGGVATINASTVYVNNTIAGNSATYGGGFYCKDSISPDFYNNIIWGNTANVGPQGYLFEAFSQADFYYCDVEGGPEQFGGSGGGAAFTGDFENCLDENPDFLGYGKFPYSIPVNSPCFNAGTPDTTGLMLPATDLELNPRLVMSAIDIGADEVYPYGVDVDRSLENRIKVWPNPFTDHVFVEVETGDAKKVLIEIMDLQGRKMKEISGEILPGGKQQFILPMNETGTSGVYLFRISIDNNFLTYKLVRKKKS